MMGDPLDPRLTEFAITDLVEEIKRRCFASFVVWIPRADESRDGPSHMRVYDHDAEHCDALIGAVARAHLQVMTDLVDEGDTADE